MQACLFVEVTEVPDDWTFELQSVMRGSGGKHCFVSIWSAFISPLMMIQTAGEKRRKPVCVIHQRKALLAKIAIDFYILATTHPNRPNSSSHHARQLAPSQTGANLFLCLIRTNTTPISPPLNPVIRATDRRAKGHALIGPSLCFIISDCYILSHMSSAYWGSFGSVPLILTACVHTLIWNILKLMTACLCRNV